MHQTKLIQTSFSLLLNMKQSISTSLISSSIPRRYLYACILYFVDNTPECLSTRRVVEWLMEGIAKWVKLLLHCPSLPVCTNSPLLRGFLQSPFSSRELGMSFRRTEPFILYQRSKNVDPRRDGEPLAPRSLLHLVANSFLPLVAAAVGRWKAVMTSRAQR